jgi:3-hydroxyisobutyrate dehydrogenase-like beta-hydroxyacid dehydrogenase
MSHAIALLHPGAMGTALGQCLRAAGHRVGWCSAGRSARSAERAAANGFDTFAALADLLRVSDIAVAVCPPDAAVATARTVADAAFTGIYVDANAVAPATAMTIAGIVESAGARFVDGGIIGPPPRAPGTTWLYLSGEHARVVAPVFANPPLTVVDLGVPATAASALKMCYAAWTKGSSALLLAVAALARASGVDAALAAQWQQSDPELPHLLAAHAARDAPKAWRFAGEMREIAATFATHGLSPQFHAGAAQTFAALAGFRDADPPPDLDRVLASLPGDTSADT